MEYRAGKLLLTLKRIHTIAQLDLESGKLDWVLAPKSIWQDTELEAIALKTEGADIEWEDRIRLFGWMSTNC